MLIGLTGGIGTGKSTLCKVADDLGFFVIDADKIGHSILIKDSCAYNEIVESFGKEILSPDGEIDRKKLGGIVFTNPEKLLLLNKITHQKITEKIEKMIEKCDNETAVLEAAVLFESGMDKICDVVVAVIAPKEERARRISERDGVSIENAMLRINSQKNDDFYLSKADRIIFNNGSIEKLYSDGLAILKEEAYGKS